MGKRGKKNKLECKEIEEREEKEEREKKEREEREGKEEKENYMKCGLALLPFAEAWDRQMEKVPLEESIGRCAGEFVNLYPPGIPLLVPGERITKELYHSILEKFAQGLTVQGIESQVWGQNTEGQMEGKTRLYIYVIEDIEEREDEV